MRRASRARTACGVLGALWVLAGAAGLLLPAEWVPADVVNNDTVAHAVAFAVAVALWTAALPGRALAVLAVAAAGAVASEVLQAVLLDGREAGWTDMAANGVGIAAGLAAGAALSAAIAGWERWAPHRRGR